MMNKKLNDKIFNFDDIYSTYTGPISKKSKDYFSKINSWDSGHFTELAYLIGKIMGDGHLDNNFSLKFVSGDKNTLFKLNNLLKEKFDISQEKLKINQKLSSKGKSFVLGVNFTPFGLILYSLGAPKGNKTKISFPIPSWIKRSNDCKKNFLQGILEDDLTTIKIVKCSYSNAPMLKLSKEKHLVNELHNFLFEIKDLLNDFGIFTSKVSEPLLTKTNKYDLYFRIQRNKENIIRFSERVGFRFDSNKIEKLNDCVAKLKKSLIQKKDI